jgi:MFS transporter, SP family, galactose:H+ symporter
MNSNVNFAYSIGYVVTAALGFFNLGYTFSYFNNIMELMYSQYKNDGVIIIDDKESFNSFINALIPFAAILGAPIGWKLSTGGRRRAFQIVAFVMTFSCSITIIENFYTLVVGRIIMGFCCGSYVTLIPLVVSEVSPGCIGGPLGVVGQVMTVSGIFSSITFGFAVPYSGDENELTSNIWRVLMIFPALIAAIQFCLFQFIYTLDTPTFYELNNDQENYDKIMARLYKNPKKAGADTLLEDEDREVEKTPLMKSIEMPWSELFFGKYRKTLVVGVMLGFFHQATGISMVTFLSQDIFVKGFEGKDRQYHARLGTFGVGIAGLLAGICGLIASQFYGRKQIITTG